jgi:hypothetical protein
MGVTLMGYGIGMACKFLPDLRRDTGIRDGDPIVIKERGVHLPRS